jgi:photosystem II stability/assembly factor-like uncharacterized protein
MILLRRINRYRQSVVMLIVLLMFFTGTLVPAARKKATATDPELRLKEYREHVAMQETSRFKHLEWQFLGPTNVSGRMTDMAVVTPKGQHYTIYVAGASGGVWKTVNEGTSWEPVFQHAASTSIGDIAIAPSRQEIVWVGTGEANIFRSSQAGIGVYKSTDAGKTWQHMGLTGTYTISRIIIHPQNPDIVYVAASGHEWTHNIERGVYKTFDGGKTWKNVLGVNEKTGAIDLVMDPADPNILYAATWERTRKKWNDPRNEPKSSGSGIYKTSDGGETWTTINKGLPPAKFRGRIGIDICRSKPNVLYAFIDDYEVIGQWSEGQMDSYGRPKMGKIKGATVYRTDDSGSTWRQVSQANQYMEELSATYGWVFGQIRVDPNDENRIYVMGLGVNVSEDGGKTFRELGQLDLHGDNHGMWIDPANSNYLVNVDDGGLSISYDRGAHWRIFTHNLPLAQFFNVMYDMADPFHVYGSIQDHGSYRGVVDLSKGRHQIPAVEWEEAPGGEGSSHAIDPTDPNIVYSAGFYGNITRTDLKTKKQKLIVPRPAKGEPPYRGQWVAPFIISPHNPQVIYHGMNYLFRSLDRGDSWERISPDLTYNDKNKKGDIPYQTIFAISESPLKFGLIYVGTDDGRAHVTKDGGKNWLEITNGLAEQKWVSRIAASAFAEGTVYLSQNGKRDDDFAAYLWKSLDYGKTWQDISHNLPGGPVNVIREDPKNKDLLYVGTDLGVYVSMDGGKYWQVLSNHLPTTYVHDLVIHPRDSILVAATHGRGMWAMDVRELQQLTPEILAKNLYLFAADPAKLPQRSWWGWTGGQNAFFYYYLKEPGEVKVIINDESGKKIQELNGTGDMGLNVSTWNLKPAQPPVPKEGKAGEPQSPFVEPGKYQVAVTAGSVNAEGTVEVKK